MNEQNFNCGCYRNKDYYNNEFSNYSNEKDNNFKKDSCCVKRVEETFCCIPSYYNEEKEDKVDTKEKCFEGTFRICPKSYDCNQNNRKNDSCKQEDINNSCYEDGKKKCREDNCRMNHHSCCFCRLFRW